MWPARSTPLASRDAGEPQPSVPPQSRGLTALWGGISPLMLQSCVVCVLPSLCGAEAGQEPSPPAAQYPLGILASREPTLLYLILHLILPFPFAAPTPFLPTGYLPNNPHPITFPSSILVLLNLYLNCAFPRQYQPKVVLPTELSPGRPRRIRDSLPPLQFTPVISRSQSRLPGQLYL